VQASQQLGLVLAHAEPPIGAVQRLALDFVEHFVTPFFVRQQATKFGFPQVDFAAHLTTTPLQLWFTRFVRACSPAHLTYWPWFVNEPQTQFVLTAVRAAATSAASTPVGSHLAKLRCAVNASSENAIAVSAYLLTLGLMITSLFSLSPNDR
jgi:hypothetical protein